MKKTIVAFLLLISTASYSQEINNFFTKANLFFNKNI